MQYPYSGNMQQPTYYNQMVQQPQTQYNPAKYKTSLCRHFIQNKMCQLSTRCQFAHGEHELRQANDPIPTGANLINPASFKTQTASGNYKSMICKYFQNGFCKNENNCTFAHGDQDLQGMAQNQIQNRMVSDQQQQMRIQAMYQIIQSLQQVVLVNDVISVNKLQQAQHYIMQNDTQNASNIVQEIMQDPKRTQQELALYNQIFNSAQQQLNLINQQVVNQSYYQR